MSYALSAFVVDIPKLESIIGSKDASVIDAVKANNAEFFEEEEEEFDDDELWLSTAIQHLVMGEERDPEEAHQYGYALQEICDYLGDPQDCDIWSGVRWGCVEGCGLEDLLTKTGPPVELPPNDDFPNIGHIRRGEVNEYLQAATNRAENCQDGEIQELLDEYISWLKTAQSSSLDIVFFYH